MPPELSETHDVFRKLKMSRQPKDRSDLPPPEGFTFLKPDTDSFYGSAANGRKGLFLPTQLHSALLDERVVAEAAAHQALVDKRAAELDAESREAERRQGGSKPFVTVAGVIEREAVFARQEALVKQQQAAELNPHAWHRVYAPEAPVDLQAKTLLIVTDKELKKRDEGFAQKLIAAGPYRKMATPGAAAGVARVTRQRSGRIRSADQQLKAVYTALEKLRVTHPHFGQVIDFVMQHQALSSRSKAALPMTPILLNGESGLGKTHFAFDLAAVIGTTCRKVAFDTPVTAATLMGSDRRWANTQIGLLFELVCLGQYANPVIVLDEIDKANQERAWNPLGPLHTLLEPSTAAKIRDVSADFEFDASQVIWIATSNDSRLLTGPIRSRFREFHILRPDAAGALASSKAVLKNAFAALQLVRFSPPSKELAVALAHLTPRQITQVVKVAAANAIQKGKNALDLDDLPEGICEELDRSRGRTKSDSNGSCPEKVKAWLH